MKKLLLVLISLGSICASAQVKFIPENVKNKPANTVYTNIANTFTVSIPQEITVTNITPSQGNIRMNTDGSFSLYVHEANDTPLEIKYTQTKNAVETEVTYPVKYIVKRMPGFLLKVGEYTQSGKVSLAKIKKNHRISIHEENANTGTQNRTIQFDLLHQPAKGSPNELNNLSNTPESIKLLNEKINTLQAGDKIFFENIRITDESGITQKGENLNFIIVQ